MQIKLLVVRAVAQWADKLAAFVVHMAGSSVNSKDKGACLEEWVVNKCAIKLAQQVLISTLNMSFFKGGPAKGIQQGGVAYSSYPVQQQGRAPQMAGHGVPTHQEPLTSQMLASASPQVSIIFIVHKITTCYMNRSKSKCLESVFTI